MQIDVKITGVSLGVRRCQQRFGLTQEHSRFEAGIVAVFSLAGYEIIFGFLRAMRRFQIFTSPFFIAKSTSPTREFTLSFRNMFSR
jgi:hypothetical protein